MHRRFFALLTLLAPLALASCFSTPPEPAPQAEDGSIFNRPPRYGHGGTETAPPYPPQTPPAGGQVAGDPPPPPESQRGYDWQRYKQEMGITDPQPAPAPPQGQTAGAPPAPPTGGVASSDQAPPPPPPGPADTTPPPPPSTGGSDSSAQQTAPPATASTDEAPYGIPVPGKDGMLFSPYNKDAGYIDITTRGPDGSVTVLPPGTKIKDPFSGKPILVP